MSRSGSSEKTETVQVKKEASRGMISDVTFFSNLQKKIRMTSTIVSWRGLDMASNLRSYKKELGM